MCVSFSPGRFVFSSFGLWLGWCCSESSQADAVGGGRGDPRVGRAAGGDPRRFGTSAVGEQEVNVGGFIPVPGQARPSSKPGAWGGKRHICKTVLWF